MSRGRFVWHDMMSTDAKRAKAFYTELFGWTADPMDMGGMGVHHVLANRGREFGGVMPLDPAHGMSSRWIPYIGCEDVDADAARTAELGGTIAYPPESRDPERRRRPRHCAIAHDVPAKEERRDADRRVERVRAARGETVGGGSDRLADVGRRGRHAPAQSRAVLNTVRSLCCDGMIAGR